MEKNNKKNGLPVFILVVSLVFGTLGGILSSVYLWPNFFSDFRGTQQDIDLDSPEYSSANFIIRDPKRVYISQDLKVDESKSYLSEAVVGVFLKPKNILESEKAEYILEKELLSGVVISSDGWVLLNVLGLNNFDKNILKNKELYSVISRKEKKIYDIEDIFWDSSKELLFMKIKDINNFPVRNFVNISELSSGQTVLAYNFGQQISVNYLKDINSGGVVKFTNNFKNLVLLDNTLSADFKNGFIFDLNGNLLALIDSNLAVRPIHDFRFDIYGFLKNKEIKIFNFGLYYINLTDLAGSNLPLAGALVRNNSSLAVSKGSLAEVAGILEGDVITKINNYELTQSINLNDVLNNFSWGDKISIFVLRAGELKELKLDIK